MSEEYCTYADMRHLGKVATRWRHFRSGFFWLWLELNQRLKSRNHNISNLRGGILLKRKMSSIVSEQTRTCSGRTIRTLHSHLISVQTPFPKCNPRFNRIVYLDFQTILNTSRDLCTCGYSNVRFSHLGGRHCAGKVYIFL